ncbi:recombinase family protein [Actinosynnema sp. NPDC047251]|uniref:Recombinase n=1 Tax=Saccharothrix espanaensis (strain ATCC 51144 / DSM 44229 / JCM 9112 / NBRC 15066 / NRRL 15764) TaxID=1179773 RepID=K0K653_SACES|nr:recombinase family protein [Saccharothrix espanaensis]CCH33022.1 Recombinase [Saccharothrix espanaensis DSM 44229]
MTAEISRDPWATLDELLGIEVADTVEDGIGTMAGYGRCSTEDNQDPQTSRGWQFGNARKFVEPFGGVVTEEFFDIGQSRSVPWDRRDAASELLAALKNPYRGWNAVVVGEGTRCWFGNQFSLIAPRFEAYGVDLWVPELGGKYDPRNPSHKMLMSVLGGMSESERQHVQARVRAAMDAQVLNEGRHQGGRAPYGYETVDGGPHPNPRKSVEGYRLRVLAVDEQSAWVVRRIFAEYLSGRGDRAIATGLNRDRIPCPSARRPDQNPHRSGDGWQGSTVRAILDNPRYTGYAFFGRWMRQEMLLDPDDVAAGNVIRFRRASADRVVRSRRPAHPEIVSVEVFTQAQLLRKSKYAGGLRTARKTERAERPTKQAYLFRGRLRCTVCERKMEASPRARGMYYRCPARTLPNGSPALGIHPPTIYLREDVLVDAVNKWLGELFAPKNVDRTVCALVDSQGTVTPTNHDSARKRLAKAEKELARFQAAIIAGIDPMALVEPMNEAQAVRAAAKAELEGTPPPDTLTAAEVHAMIDSLGDVGAALREAKTESLLRVYQGLDLQVLYKDKAHVADVMIKPVGYVNSARVRGGT